MRYLLLGNLNLVNKKILDIQNENNISFNSVIKYDLEVSNIKEVINELETISLFSEKKLVIVYNFECITEENVLISYFEKEDDSNIFVITSQKELDKRKKITKILEEKCKKIDYLNFNHTDEIKKQLEGYKVSDGVINLLFDYCNDDFERIENELDKIKMYCIENKIITKDIVEQLVMKSINNNIFELINALNSENKDLAFNIVYNLISLNEDEIKIFITLANNYRLIYRVKVLQDEVSDNSIMELLNIKNPYRLKKLKEQTYLYEIDELLDILKLLGDLDIKIKSGVYDKRTALELFISKV